MVLSYLTKDKDIIKQEFELKAIILVTLTIQIKFGFIILITNK